MQHFICIALVLLVSTACFLSIELIGYRVVALILLVTVSILAMLFDILPVLIAAVLSALIWNFFFIPPLYTFRIGNAEDLLMFLMYFIIAMVNGVLTFKIREAENKARDKEEKENAIKLYNTLLNSLSHEMRTPLSTIIGSVDTLKENSKNLSSENKDDLFNQIDIASIRLNRQVENLLNMNRLETGMLQLNRDWCDVNELIFSVIQKFDGTQNSHKILFEPNENLPLFKLDGGLMEQVFYNLIHNGIQYTPEKSTIRIEALYQSNDCIVTVSDNGNGFPENEIKLVFDKFYRLPNSKTGGTGLGLSIAKGFTEAHNGKILLQNTNEGGAKFTVSIPAETSFINNLKNE
jgi:two-component system, OmpR family, sensor histidine kinase KdpD